MSPFQAVVVALLAVIAGAACFGAFLLAHQSTGQLRQTSAVAHQANRENQDVLLSDRDEAVQEVTKSDAAQIAIALLAYTQDYDEAFPPASNLDVPALITPYMGARPSDLREIFGVRPGVLDAENPVNPVFAYTFKGGKVSASVAWKTPLGYKRGPVGRAVFYADGHYEWKADKPLKARP